jgi:peptidyl-Lys metalloendopeptidase
MEIRSFFISATLLLATFTMTPCQAATTVRSIHSIHCEIGLPSRSVVSKSDEFVLRLHNAGTQSVSLLRRNTPLEAMFSDQLRVTRNGKRLDYVGPMAKRPAPTAQEYLRLLPGERHENLFKVADGYDVSQPGRYQVSWNGEFMDAMIGDGTPTPENPIQHRVRCKPLRFTK